MLYHRYIKSFTMQPPADKHKQQQQLKLVVVNPHRKLC